MAEVRVIRAVLLLALGLAPTACSSWVSSGPPAPREYNVDTSRCVEVPLDLRAEIESSLRVGAVGPGTLPGYRLADGDELEYLIRLDRAELLSWAAVPSTPGNAISALWIGVETDMEQSWSLNEPDAPWHHLNDAKALDLYVLTADLDGSERLYIYRDDEGAYKTRLSSLVESRGRIESIGGWDHDATASLAACLGYEATGSIGSEYSLAWIWQRGWYGNANEPRSS